MKPVIKCNDNLVELKKIPDGSIDLAYIDPPFFTNRDFGDFSDKWKGMDEYLAFMKPRIEEIHRALKPTGSLYIHADWHSSAYLRVLVDKVFGMKNFRNDITWERTRSGKGGNIKTFARNKDTILYYTNSKEYTFNPITKPVSENRAAKFNHVDRSTGRRFVLNKMVYPGNSPKEIVFVDRGKVRAPDGRRFAWSQSTYDEAIKKDPGVIYWSKNGIPSYKKYADEHEGAALTSHWSDVPALGASSSERAGYQTQKPERLLDRIITVSSNPGDVVLDAFAGSGTTCVVANKLGRKSICVDMNPRACKIMEERLK
jgi:DNA modification methylase